MRTLLLFRGAPGSGKSTFIERHGLKRYTLSADEIIMRGVAYETLKKGYVQKTGPLVDKMSNEFYAFCQKLYRYRKNDIIDNVPNNIIKLRKHFLKNKED